LSIVPLPRRAAAERRLASLAAQKKIERPSRDPLTSRRETLSKGQKQSRRSLDANFSAQQSPNKIALFRLCRVLRDCSNGKHQRQNQKRTKRISENSMKMKLGAALIQSCPTGEVTEGR
jgi:hypothetical protein